jgi:hypothetical protein
MSFIETKTLSGKKVLIDISEKTCSSFNLKHGDLIKHFFLGEGVFLGVSKIAYEERKINVMWVRFEILNGGVSYTRRCNLEKI